MCQNCPVPVPADPHDPETLASSRRAVLTGGAALAAAGFVASATPAHAAAESSERRGRPRTRLTVLGSTDLHGHALNWDYYKNAEYDDAAHNDVGIAKVATLIRAMRKKRRGEPILTLDAGDTIQGTPLAYYFAKVHPIGKKTTHPMAKAMNVVGYDAAALGNHEFNYGIPFLRTFERQVDFPLLGANAVDHATKRPVFRPFTVKTYRPEHGPELRVGILGLTNPGIAIWDKANTAGQMEFPGLVETAAQWVPRMRKKHRCDVVIVSAHSGADTSSSYGDALPYPENAATLLAEQVPGIDAILVGHAHVDIPQRFVTNKATGKQVLLCEPYCWGYRLAVMDLHLEHRGKGGWHVTSSRSQNLNSNVAAPRKKVVKAVRKQHDKVVAYVNSVIGSCTQTLSAARAVVEDVPIIDFVNYVQADAVKTAIGGALPILSIAAPFNRSATFPSGNVTLRDVAGLYIYDNTLLAIQVSGKNVRDYLEYDMAYFQQVSGTGPFTMAQVTNAKTSKAPNGTPDYNFDSIAGLDAHLTYDIDISQPVGSRIKNLAYGGTAVTDGQQFALAINNYRQSGGGGFPAVSTAPVLWNAQVAITQLLIDWVTAHKTIDPAAFASKDWRLVSGSTPLTIT